MKRKSDILIKMYRGMIYILPAVLYFSYYPVIRLGGDETMNFELSLPLLWLMSFGVLSVVMLIRERRMMGLVRKWKFLLFPLFVTLSVVWSANVVRGLLTGAVMWLIVVAVVSFILLKDLVRDEKFVRNFWRWFFGSALVVCGWCVVQCILDVAGVPRECTLMCAGCGARMFGFPHPNGFAIEPQFMGNLLLAPAIMSAWLVIRKRTNRKLELEPSRVRVFYNRSGGLAPKLQFPRSSVTVVKNTSGSGCLGSNFLLVCFFVFSSTLFLTFSRGAIYAFIVAMIFMVVYMGVRQKSFKVLKVFVVVAVAFAFTLNLQGVMAQVGPTNDTYASGVAKVLNHLSLGVIDIRVRDGSNAGAVSEETIMISNEAVFDGYVEESTEIRKMMTRNASTVWKRDFKTVMFGVGIGGAGRAMYEAGLIGSPKEIVQNEYASLLLEVGLTGVVLAFVMLILIVRAVIRNPTASVILSLLIAYGVSLMFFAGLPNALQVYLMPGILYIVLRKKLVS